MRFDNSSANILPLIKTDWDLDKKHFQYPYPSPLALGISLVENQMYISPMM